jgi:Predicted transmembrane transcriptional regulator (anti-sigma factor)
MYSWFRKILARISLKKSNTSIITTKTLTCKEVVELVTDYLEGVLPSEKRAELEAHLADCPGCTNYIEQMRLTIGVLRNLSQEPVFPATKEELVQAFRQWKQN